MDAVEDILLCVFVCVCEAANTVNRSPVASGAACCGQSEECAREGFNQGPCGTWRERGYCLVSVTPSLLRLLRV